MSLVIETPRKEDAVTEFVLFFVISRLS
jgi:hypothetical protein